jgi:alpha-L-fucosidase
MNPFTRRIFIKTGVAAATASALPPRFTFAAQTAAQPRLVLPTPAQVAWQDAEVGIIYDFDLAIAAGDTTENNAARKTWDPNLYQPDKLDTDQWLAAAKAAGAGYAIFTATHFNGFMQWQSDLYPYGLKQTKWRDGKGDVVGDFVASCRRVGIKPGIFFSVHRNVYQQVWGHYVDWGKGRGTPAQEKFNRIAEQQMEELCSRYGPLIQIWFDAGTKTPAEGGPDMLPIFRRHQPQSVFYHSAECGEHRWIGNEAGYAGNPCWATMPEQSQAVLLASSAAGRKILNTGFPDGPAWSPGMVDVPLRGANKVHNWFWSPDQDHAIESTETLVRMYDQSVGRNCNFIIGAAIQPDGTLPEPDAKRLAEFGAEIKRRYGQPVAETKGEGETVELQLPAPAQLDAVMIMEDIARGERVREYLIEGRAPGGEWAQLGTGQSIGHKRIQSFSRQKLASVRLRFTKTIASPAIRRLAVFDTNRP